FGATSPPSGSTASRATSTAGAGSGRPRCTGPTIRGGSEARGSLLQGLPQILDRLTGLPLPVAPRLLHAAGGLVGLAFVVEVRVVFQVGRRLFGLPLDGLYLAFQFVAVHSDLPPVR